MALAILAERGTVWLWNARIERARRLEDAATEDVNHEGPSHNFALAWSPDGRSLASSCGDDVLVWDVETSRITNVIRGTRTRIVSATFSADGEQLALGTADGKVSEWDVHAKDTTMARLRSASKPRLSGIAAQSWFSLDGRHVGQIAGGGSFVVFAVDSGGARACLTTSHSAVFSATFSTSADLLALTGSRGYVELWHWPTGRLLNGPGGLSGTFTALAFSPNGDQLAVATGPDGAIKLWNVPGEREIDGISARIGIVRALAFSPDGSTLAVGGNNGAITLWTLPLR
jgi:WD40 repeat protein